MSGDLAGHFTLEQLTFLWSNLYKKFGARCGTVGLGTALQAEWSWFRFSTRYWDFSLTYSFRPHYDPGVDLACNRNEYQEYVLGNKGGRCVGLTTLATSCAKYLEILVASTFLEN